MILKHRISGATDVRQQPVTLQNSRREVDLPYQNFSYFDVEVDDGVAIARFGDEASRGALSEAGHAELPRLLPALQADDSVRAVLVTGWGGMFCTGASAEWRAAVANDVEVRIESLRAVRSTVWSCLRCDKPVVSAINGPARGVALTFALLADIVIAERQVTFNDTHLPAAIHPGDGGLITWPVAMGPLRAKRFLLTGDAIDAEEAERLGLVSEVVDTGESLERAREFASRLAAGPSIVLRETKQIINRYLTWAATQTYDASWGLEMTTLGSPQSAAALEDLAAGKPGAVPPDPRRTVKAQRPSAATVTADA
jgi:enoyl-CoA hydratase